MIDTEDDDRVALLMRAADPCPAPERDELTDEHRRLRDRITAGNGRRRRVVRDRQGLRVASNWVGPLSAVAATAAVVAVAVAIGAAVLDAQPGPVARDPRPTEAANPLYRSDFEAARERATSEFERRVLADDVITSDEYDEAVGLYVQCVREAGLTIRTRDAGGGLRGYEIGGSWDDELADRVAGDCSVGTIGVVEGLYGQIVQNPQKADWDDLVAACLVAAGFVDAPYTGELFARDNTEPVFVERMMDDPRAAACVTAPQG